VMALHTDPEMEPEDISGYTPDLASRYAQVTALQKDCCKTMSNMAAQLSELRREVEDLQSKKVEGALSEVQTQNLSGQMSSMEAHLSYLRHEVENLQSKQYEGRWSLKKDLSVKQYEEAPSSPRKSDAELYSKYKTMKEHAADVFELQYLFDQRAEPSALRAMDSEEQLQHILSGKAETVACQKNDAALEALSSLQSRLKGASSVIGVEEKEDEKNGVLSKSRTSAAEPDSEPHSPAPPSWSMPSTGDGMYPIRLSKTVVHEVQGMERVQSWSTGASGSSSSLNKFDLPGGSYKISTSKGKDQHELPEALLGG